MNLQPQAETEQARRTRSKLETHREAIFALRRKHWTHRQIAQWLNEHGVQITLSAVHRFCQRTIARRPRSNDPLPATESVEESAAKSFPIQTPATKNNQHRFNLDI
jgi:hypothetical protein